MSELRVRSVLALRLALAFSSILITTRSFSRSARASVKSIEAGRPSRQRLPGEPVAAFLSSTAGV